MIIPLEDTGKELSPKLAELKRLSSERRYRLLVHPLQAADIQRDKDEQRKAIVLSRLAQYEVIASPPYLTDEDLERYGWNQNKENDFIDNSLLHALCCGAVHIFVTNDNGIHKKAAKAGVSESVYRVEQFISLIQRSVDKPEPPPFGIEECFLYELDHNNSFFDSLRQTYEPAKFNAWIKESSKKERKAWCIRDGRETIFALCIYKHEENEPVLDCGNLVLDKALKLCTFKVSHAVRGRKLGERLLYAAFKHATKHQQNWVYLHTAGDEQRTLVELCLDYGFELAGSHKGQKGQDVYLKSMMPPTEACHLSPLEYAIRYYPNYIDDNSVKKFIIPIQPHYHDDLFADTSGIARGLHAKNWKLYNPQGNTIKKAYISKSRIKKMSPGDVILFYRSDDRKSIECVGVVEKAEQIDDINRLRSIVSKRTVYSDQELIDLLSSQLLVLLFRHVKYIDVPIGYDEMENAGIKGYPQSIREISHECYHKLMYERPKPQEICLNPF